MSNFAKVQLEQIWQKTLQLINESAHFDDAVFNAWYKEDSHLFDIEDDFATIVVPYKINKQIMMDSIDLIQQKLSDVLDMKVSCQILLKSEVDMLQPSSVIKRRNEILFEDKVKRVYLRQLRRRKKQPGGSRSGIIRMLLSRKIQQPAVYIRKFRTGKNPSAACHRKLC